MSFHVCLHARCCKKYLEANGALYGLSKTNSTIVHEKDSLTARKLTEECKVEKPYMHFVSSSL